MSRTLPIGIFDSGIGGLTVAGAVKKLLPNEDIIYFGDTAHMPYGDKSKELIIEYSKNIAHFLMQQPCKAIIIACNTASAYAYESLREMLPKDLILLNVIEPAAKYVATVHNSGKIGVIGTRGTINTGAYRKTIVQHNAKADVYELATPLLAPLIEEGYYNNSVSAAIINAYLSYPDFAQIDALILGCTHYPLVKAEIAKFFNHRVELVDSAEQVAASLLHQLTEKSLLNLQEVGTHSFYVSDISQSFASSAKRFFGHPVALVEKRL
ncbi:MAG: glutamate racemase [Luteibaculaceae bacterium]